MSEMQFSDQDRLNDHAAWLAGEGGGKMSRFTRRLSERTSRRSAISRFARWTMGITGVAMVASLPVTRDPKASAQSSTSPSPTAPSGGTEAFGEGDDLLPTYDGKDPTKCDYWRWCNMDGTPCTSCAGGGIATCAPGSKPGAEYWVGCCTNPADGKTYLIAYYDCCGAPGCSTTYCGEPDAQAVMYNPVSGSFDQEIIWCISDESQSYTCTLSPIVGEDCQTQKATRPRVGAGSR
jgi:methylamine dehydrogenase light chain